MRRKRQEPPGHRPPAHEESDTYKALFTPHTGFMELWQPDVELVLDLDEDVDLDIFYLPHYRARAGNGQERPESCPDAKADHVDVQVHAQVQAPRKQYDSRCPRDVMSCVIIVALRQSRAGIPIVRAPDPWKSSLRQPGGRTKTPVQRRLPLRPLPFWSRRFVADRPD